METFFTTHAISVILLFIGCFDPLWHCVDKVILVIGQWSFCRNTLWTIVVLLQTKINQTGVDLCCWSVYRFTISNGTFLKNSLVFQYSTEQREEENLKANVLWEYASYNQSNIITYYGLNYANHVSEKRRKWYQSEAIIDWYSLNANSQNDASFFFCFNVK